MKLRIDETEIKIAVAEYINRQHGITVKPEQLNPIMVTHGAYDDTEKVMEGYELDVPNDAMLRNKLAGVNGTVSINDGVMTLEDGTTIEL